MKKKLVSILLSTAMITSLLAGCGSGKEAETTDTTTETSDVAVTDTATTEAEAAGDFSGDLTVLTHRTDLIDTKYADYKKEFEARYPDVNIKFEAITDYEGDVAIRMGTSDYGDVLMLPNSIPNNEFPDFFEPLGSVEELSAKYKSEFLNAKISEGQVYGLASCANAQGIVYNKKVFEAAGITETPKTPEDFLAALQKIKDNTEAVPYYTNYAAGWTLTAWEDHAWGSVTGNANYHNNDIVHEAAPFSEGTSHYTIYKLLFDIVSQKLCEEDPVTTDWEQSKVMLNKGEIGCMVLGSWAVSQMKAAGDNADDIGYMPFPTNVDGKQYATAGADYCYAINKNSEQKDLARAWIDFMVDESGFALSEGSISLVKEDPLPDTLLDFKDVTFIVDEPATAENEGLFDELSNTSEVSLYTDVEKKRIVEAAMGNTNESFEDIMNDWNAKWAEGQKELNITAK